MVRRAWKNAVIAMASLSMMMGSAIPAMAKTGRPDTEGQWKLEKQAWSFQDSKANTVKGWMVYKGDWYFLDESTGFLKTGWLSRNGKSYFFNTEKGSREGALLSGWNWIDGYCYYFSEKDDESYGELQKSTTTADGYKLDDSGRWVDESGSAYYVAGHGISASGTAQQVAGASRPVIMESSPSRGGSSSGRTSGGSAGRNTASQTDSNSTAGSEKKTDETKPEKTEDSKKEDETKPEKPEEGKKEDETKPEKPEDSKKEEETKPEKPEDSKKEEETKPEKPEDSKKEDGTKPEKPEEGKKEEETKPEKPEENEQQSLAVLGKAVNGQDLTIAVPKEIMTKLLAVSLTDPEDRPVSYTVSGDGQGSIISLDREKSQIRIKANQAVGNFKTLSRPGKYTLRLMTEEGPLEDFSFDVGTEEKQIDESDGKEFPPRADREEGEHSLKITLKDTFKGTAAAFLSKLNAVEVNGVTYQKADSLSTVEAGEGLYFVEDKTLYLSIPKEKVGEVTLRADGFMHLIVSAQ